MLTYKVYHYKFDKLVALMCEHKDTKSACVERKDNLKYFKKYFEEVQAGTIVKEFPYIDRGFMEDYAGYYSRCFHRYVTVDPALVCISLTNKFRRQELGIS